MSKHFFRILVLAIGATFVVFVLIASTYVVCSYITPEPIARRYVPPVREEPPDNPNLSEADKQLLKQHRATIEVAKTEIDSWHGEMSGTGGDRRALDNIATMIEHWEFKKKIAECEIARIRAGETVK